LNRDKKYIAWVILLLSFLATIFGPTITLARTESLMRPVSRGEATYLILNKFDLKNKKRAFLNACAERPAECFFVFTAMSDFDDIAFEPFLKLYPDVTEKYRYYSAIIMASMLGLIHGYMDEEKTPFKPEIVMTRIQVLKVILGAADLLRWKERFELSPAELEKNDTFADEALSNPEKWWYPRYLDFAVIHGLVPEGDLFRPDEPVTLGELMQILDSTQNYLAENN